MSSHNLPLSSRPQPTTARPGDWGTRLPSKPAEHGRREADAVHAGCNHADQMAVVVVERGAGVAGYSADVQRQIDLTVRRSHGAYLGDVTAATFPGRQRNLSAYGIADVRGIGHGFIAVKVGDQQCQVVAVVPPGEVMSGQELAHIGCDGRAVTCHVARGEHESIADICAASTARLKRHSRSVLLLDGPCRRRFDVSIVIGTATDKCGHYR